MPADDDNLTEVELWPETGEDREEFMDRCVIALTPCIGEDDAVDVCTEKWVESHRLGKKGVVTRGMLDGNLKIEPCGETCMGCKGRDAPFDPRQAILDAARATLARPIPGGDRTNTGAADRFIAESDRRQREAEQQQHERHDRLTDFEAAALGARVRAELAGMIDAQSAFLQELMAEAVAYLQREIAAKVNEAVGSLRADIAVQRGVDREGSNVIDMPDFLRKQSS